MQRQHAHFLHLTPPGSTNMFRRLLRQARASLRTQPTYARRASLEQFEQRQLLAAFSFFTDQTLAVPGLVGSYVNQSLASYSPQDDWRQTQPISGVRFDPVIDFRTNNWGQRSLVGVTGGTDANWDNFSVQWDGFLRIFDGDTTIRTISDNGSRMWIDTNFNQIFETTELVDNNWGQVLSIPNFPSRGPLSAQLSTGTFPVRIQYEDTFGSNTIQVTENPQEFLEQEFIYLLNRARRRPQEFPTLFVSGARPTPLAASLFDSDNPILGEAAIDQAADMADAGVLFEQDSVNQFIFNAGYLHPYPLEPGRNDIQSIADGVTAFDALQDMLFNPVYRPRLLGLNEFAPNSEIGVGYDFNFISNPQDFWAVDMAYVPNANPFLTGVVFDDLNGNGRYDTFEGLEGVRVSAGTFETRTSPGGGWSLQVTPGTYTVRASGGELENSADVDNVVVVAGTNVEVDFIEGLDLGIVDFATTPLLPTISINDVTLAEGNASGVTLLFTVSINSIRTENVRVGFSTVGANATPSVDFIFTSGTATILAGTTSTTIPILVNADTSAEFHERLFVVLSNPQGGVLGKSIGIGTIVNDDGPGLIISDASVTEPDSGSTNMVFVVSLVPAGIGTPVTVEFATAPGTATAGVDYTAVTGTLTFAPSTFSQTISVPIIGDATIEQDETFFVDLSNAVGSPIADSRGIGTIINDDEPPSVISIGDVSITEGNSGNRTAVFRVTRSGGTSGQVTVNFATADGTATAGIDYVASSGIVTLASGVTSQTISVPIRGDTVIEPDETFFVNLSNATGATISDSQGIGTIVDDDAVPFVPRALTIGDVRLTEGDAGTKLAVFSVRLSGPSSRVVTVDFTTLDGTAQAGTDYTAQTGTLTFPLGSTEQTISVPVVGDTIFERTEFFSVVLSAIQDAVLTDSQGQGTIVNDDRLPPTAYIGDVTVTEGNSGTVLAIFPVGLSTDSTQEVVIQFNTVDGTATAGSDYDAQSGAITFAPGETVKTITVPVTADAFAESTENFFVNLTSVTEASSGDLTGTATILFADPQTPEFIVDDGDAGYSQIGDWPTLTNLTAYQLDHRYNVAGSGGDTATWQFTSLASGEYDVMTRWVPFLNRATNAPYSIFDGTDRRGGVRVNQQQPPNDVEAAGTTWERLGTVNVLSGTLTVVLSDDANGFVIADAVRIVRRPSAAPVVVNVVSDLSIEEGPLGNANLTFLVALSSASSAPVTVGFATADGTATAGSDYTPRSGLLTFAPGTVTQTVSVPVHGDTVRELAETFFVTLSAAAGAEVGRGHATATIQSLELSWQNARDPQDVDGDGTISPLDALIVINELNRGGAGTLPMLGLGQAPSFYLDVNGDDALSALDALRVVNRLNAMTTPTTATSLASTFEAHAAVADTLPAVDVVGGTVAVGGTAAVLRDEHALATEFSAVSRGITNPDSQWNPADGRFAWLEPLEASALSFTSPSVASPLNGRSERSAIAADSIMGGRRSPERPAISSDVHWSEKAVDSAFEDVLAELLPGV